MEVLEAVKKRRSIRIFENKQIPENLISQLEDSLIWAPSAGNLQSRRFYFVYRPEAKEKLAKAAYDQNFISQAPLVVVCCADLRIELHYGGRGSSLYSLQDVAASVQNLMLVATSLGLGTVWVGAFREGDVYPVLNLPDYLRPVAIVPVGYPGEEPYPPSRMKKDQAITYIR
jgi:nitroreductase